jgi:hypothetical protein
MFSPAFWQPNTAYAIGDRAVDNNGNIQQATVAGTSGATPPAWFVPTSSMPVGGITTDHGITWELVGFETLQASKKPIGPVKETLLDAISVSRGAVDAGKVVLLNPAGQLDTSMGGGSESGTFNLDDGTFTDGKILNVQIVFSGSPPISFLTIQYTASIQFVLNQEITLSGLTSAIFLTNTTWIIIASTATGSPPTTHFTAVPVGLSVYPNYGPAADTGDITVSNFTFDDGNF